MMAGHGDAAGSAGAGQARLLRVLPMARCAVATATPAKRQADQSASGPKRFSTAPPTMGALIMAIPKERL